MPKIYWFMGGSFFCFCGQNAFAKGETTPSVLIVLHGGYNSCGVSGTFTSEYEPLEMSMVADLNDTINEIKQQYVAWDIKYIISCLESDAPPEATSYYKVSDDLETVEELFSGQFGQVLELVEVEASTPIFLIGHSYGAWTIMSLVEDFGDSYNIRGLYTIDCYWAE